MLLHLFAGLRVRDFEVARQRGNERLLGEPTSFPHATEAVGRLQMTGRCTSCGARRRPGNCVVTIFIDDLDARVAAIAERGLEPDEQLTLSNGVRKAAYRDPDGNEVAFGGAPLV